MNIVKKLPSYKQGNFVPTCPRTKSQCTYEKKPGNVFFFAKNQGELSFVQPNIFLKIFRNIDVTTMPSKLSKLETCHDLRRPLVPPNSLPTFFPFP